jgi:hypothetical protein
MQFGKSIHEKVVRNYSVFDIYLEHEFSIDIVSSIGKTTSYFIFRNELIINKLNYKGLEAKKKRTAREHVVGRKMTKK